MSIARKIALMVVLSMLTSAVVFGMALFGLQRVSASVDNITDNTLPAVLAASEVRAMYLGMNATAYDLATTSDSAKAGADRKSVV